MVGVRRGPSSGSGLFVSSVRSESASDIDAQYVYVYSNSAGAAGRFCGYVVGGVASVAAMWCASRRILFRVISTIVVDAGEWWMVYVIAVIRMTSLNISIVSLGAITHVHVLSMTIDSFALCTVSHGRHPIE